MRNESGRNTECCREREKKGIERKEERRGNKETERYTHGEGGGGEDEGKKKSPENRTLRTVILKYQYLI